MPNKFVPSLFLAALGLPFISLAQDNINPALAARENRTIANYPELMYAHTDKDSYVAGELLWFRLYCLSGITHQQSRLSQLAYVDLVDASNQVVQSAVVSLDDSSSSGSLALPLRLSSGNYELRAYTRWMLNQPQTIFRKTLNITNTLLESSGTKPDTSLRADAQVLPESGTLLAGFVNRMGLYYHERGHGFPAAVSIVSGNDTIMRFKLPPNGEGYAEFSLQPNQPYQVVFKGTQQRVVYLPVVNDGFLLQARRKGSEYQVKVLTNRLSTPKLNVVVSADHAVASVHAVSLNHGVGEVNIPFSDSTAGVATVTLYGGMAPLAERLVYFPGNEPAHQFMANLPQQAESRAAVQLPSAKQSAGTDLSLSVYYTDSLPSQSQRITDYLSLGQYVQGPIEDLDQYRSPGEATLNKIEALLLTQGWRSVLEDESSHAYSPEYGGQIVDFTVVNDANLSPASNIEFVVSVPDKPFKLQTVKTDSLGRAQMVMPGLSGLSQFYLSTPTKSGLKWKVTPMEYPRPDFKELLPVPALAYNSSEGLEQRSIAMQAQQAFRADALNSFSSYQPEDSTSFYGKGKARYDLDEYVRFQTMEEVLREYVREINVGVGGNALHMRLWDEVRRDVHEKDVLVMWNGLPVTDPSKIFNEDPLKVKYIDVIPRSYYVNGVAFKGLANFIGKQTNDLPEALTQEQTVFMLQGVHPRRQFFSPVYDSEKARSSSLPDFRTTLIWEPHYDPSKPFRFYTGDRTGKFVAVLQGMVNGEPVYEEKEIVVK